MKNNLLKKIIHILFFVLIPISIILISILIISQKKNLVIFPNPDFIIKKYDDRDNNGNSIVEEFSCTKNKIIMIYSLKKGFITPYVEISIFKKNNFFDIKKYDNLKIKIYSTKSKTLKISIRTFINNYSDINNILTFLFLQKEISIKQNIKEYILKLNDFYIPEWWYKENFSEYKKIKKDFSKVFQIVIQNGATHPIDVTDKIVLEEVSFFDSKKDIILYCGLFLFLYFLVTFSYLLLKIYKKKLYKRINKPAAVYKSLEFDDNLEEKKKYLLKYLGENYNNSNLTVKKTSYICGIPILKIPIILKNKFNLTFPQYLNKIRLMEAKRLLINTDRQIADIAFNVGFHSIEHFNRVFKKIEKMSPLSYRKKYNI